MGLLQGLGQAKPVSEFINTAGQYQTTQSNLETQRLQQHILQQQAQQVEKDNKEYHIDAALSLYPEQDRPFIKNALATAGKISPAGIVIGKDMREVPKLFEQYPKIAIGRGQMEYESLASENEKLGKKGDADSQQKMLANATRMTEIKKHIQSLSGKEEVDKSFTLSEGQARFGPDGRPIATSAPKQEVKDNFVLPSGDSVTLMKDGTYLNEDGSLYDGDRSVLQKVGQTEPKEAISDFAVFYRGQKESNPNATEASISQAWHKLKRDEAAAAGESRGAAFAASRPVQVIDRTTGRGKVISLADVEVANRLEPGRYEPIAGSPEFSADKKSYENITKGMDTVMAFEKGVQNSLTLVDNLSKQMQRTKIPGVNKLSQYIQYNAGDPNVKAFQNALTAAMTEYMKVTTAGTGISVQELTQGAQQRAKTLLEISDNPETFRKSISIMRQEMDIKKKAFESQRKEIGGRFNAAGSGATGGTAADPYGIR